MSKGLEALTDLRNDWCGTTDQKERAYDIIEKDLKALKIIKEKKVNIISLLSSIEWWNPSHYNDSVGCPIGCELTREEYNLLKEVLNEA